MQPCIELVGFQRPTVCYRLNQTVRSGEQVRIGRFTWGGIYRFDMNSRSSITLTATGDLGGGARLTEITVTGEVRIKTTLVNRRSVIRACFFNSFGYFACGNLKSEVKITPTVQGEAILAVREGQVSVSPTANAPGMPVPAGMYTVLTKTGSLTLPKSLYSGGYTVKKLTKTIGLFTPEPGWRFKQYSSAFSGPLDLKPQMINPLED